MLWIRMYLSFCLVSVFERGVGGAISQCEVRLVQDCSLSGAIALSQLSNVGYSGRVHQTIPTLIRLASRALSTSAGCCLLFATDTRQLTTTDNQLGPCRIEEPLKSACSLSIHRRGSSTKQFPKRLGCPRQQSAHHEGDVQGMLETIGSYHQLFFCCPIPQPPRAHAPSTSSPSSLLPV